MTGRLDHEKLTAYALGELQGDERAAVEQVLRTDEDARAAVAELQRMADLAVEALAAETGGGLTGAQRAAIHAKAAADDHRGAVSTRRTPRDERRPRRNRLVMAAGLLLLLGAGALSVRLLSTAGKSAQMLEEQAVEEIPDRFAELIPADSSGDGDGARAKGQGPTRLNKAKDPSVARSTDKQIRSLGYASGEEMGIAGNAGLLGHMSGTESGSGRTATGVPGSGTVVADPDGAAPEKTESFATEAYDHVTDNPYRRVTDDPLSTFSIDVDTASYANTRRFINGGSLPPAGAVRIEELVNYFDYDYAPPTRDVPFATHVEVAGCPWAPEHRLVRVGLKGWELSRAQRPASNLVFLIDVSGSMQNQNKLPLLREAMKLLVEQLDERDRVSMVVYAGSSGLVLEATPGDRGREIVAALDRLSAGGSTHGSAGIQQAYQVAQSHFIEDGVNRVILATDGDFNVGTTSQSDLVDLIEDKAASGVFLTVLGFGMHNTKDSTMEKLADKGNGNYAYIDTMNEANKVLVEQMSGTLVTIAKDVKIQVEFNPARAQAYRLVGYENRILAAEDFNDDTVDAGEIGAGHTVTALYEVVPVGLELDLPGVDPLRYQKTVEPTDTAASGELMTLKLRYKQPDGDTSARLEFPIRDGDASYAQASNDFKFAASVAMFGMLLRESPYKGTSSFGAVQELADEGRGADRHGYRAEFLQLVRKAARLAR